MNTHGHMCILVQRRIGADLLNDPVPDDRNNELGTNPAESFTSKSMETRAYENCA